MRFGVERVFASEANEIRRARQPVVRAKLVLLIDGDLDAMLAQRGDLLAIVFLEAVNVVLFMLQRAEKSELLRRVFVGKTLVFRLALAIAGGVCLVVLVLV